MPLQNWLRTCNVKRRALGPPADLPIVRRAFGMPHFNHFWGSTCAVSRGSCTHRPGCPYKESASGEMTHHSWFIYDPLILDLLWDFRAVLVYMPYKDTRRTLLSNWSDYKEKSAELGLVGSVWLLLLQGYSLEPDTCYVVCCFPISNATLVWKLG